MHAISNDLELLERAGELGVGCMGLLSDICPRPEWLNCFFALMIDELASELEACADEVLPLQWQLGQLGMSPYNIPHDLHLLLLNGVH